MNMKCVKCNSKKMYIEKIGDCEGCVFNGAWDDTVDDGNEAFIYDQEEIDKKEIEREEVEINGCCKYGDAFGNGCFIITCAKCGAYVQHIFLCEG